MDENNANQQPEVQAAPEPVAVSEPATTEPVVEAVAQTVAEPVTTEASAPLTLEKPEPATEVVAEPAAKTDTPLTLEKPEPATEPVLDTVVTEPATPLTLEKPEETTTTTATTEQPVQTAQTVTFGGTSGSSNAQAAYEETNVQNPFQDDTYYSAGTQNSEEYEKQAKKAHTFGIVSLVTSILGFISCGFCCCPFSIVAIIFGILSKKPEGGKNGIAIIGLILGIISALIGLIVYLVFGINIIVAMSAVSESSSYYY